MIRYEIIFNNEIHQLETVSFNEAVDIAIGVSNNILDYTAKVVQVDEENQTAEVNVYLNDSFTNSQTISVRKILI